MNKITQSMSLAAVLMFAASTAIATLTPATGSLGTSITASDQNYEGPTSGTLATDTLGLNGPGGYGNHEDQETETNPRTYTDQTWDLEGMYRNGNKLSLVGGFNFQTGVSWGGYTYKGGDIFIDNTGDAKYGTTQLDPLTAVGGIPFPRPTGYGATGPDTTKNVDGWDYVIHFTDATHYNVYSINSSSNVNRVLDVSSSNPWTYDSGGTQIGVTHTIDDFGSFTTNTLLTYGSTTPGLLGGGIGGNTHYYLTVDLSWLPSNHIDTFHYTVECGNDDLIGRAAIPDMASTALMLGGALAALVGLRRKLRA